MPTPRSLLTKLGRAPEWIYAHACSVRMGSRPALVKTRHGFTMWIDPHDFMDRQFLVGLYEPEVLSLAKRTLRVGDTCVDIGAHSGYFTLHMAKLVGDSGRVFAFEPDPSMMKLLAEHCVRNGFRQVQRDPSCVGTTDGTTELELSRPGWSTRHPNDASKTDKRGRITVQRVSLDSFLNVPARFVKIDAEGSESEILSGARKYLVRHKPTLCVEINHSALESANSGAEDVQVALEQMGYKLYVPTLLRRGWRPLVRIRLAEISSPAFNIAAVHATRSLGD